MFASTTSPKHRRVLTRFIFIILLTFASAIALFSFANEPYAQRDIATPPAETKPALAKIYANFSTTPHSLGNPNPILAERYVRSEYIERSVIEKEFTVSPEVSNFRSLKNTEIALVTYFVNDTGQDDTRHTPSSLYTQVVQYSLPNMRAYCSYHGFGFFSENEHLLPPGRHPFAGKSAAILYYLDRGYEWVVWTDIDVLFMNFSISLKKYAQEAEQHGKHFVGVLECGHLSYEETRRSIRSGFFMVRNTYEGREILSKWFNVYEDYAKLGNPDQVALEDIFDGEWRDRFHMFTSMDLHTYPECYRKGHFSVHFPNTNRKPMMKRWAEYAPKLVRDT